MTQTTAPSTPTNSPLTFCASFALNLPNTYQTSKTPLRRSKPHQTLTPNPIRKARCAQFTANASESDSTPAQDSPINRPGVPPFAASSQPISQSQVDQWLRDVESEDATTRLRAVLACKDLEPNKAAPILTRLFDLGESFAQNRSFAALFLGYKPNQRSYDILCGLIEAPEEMDEVRANAVAALGYLRDSRSVPLCLSLLRDEKTHWTTRSAAVVTIGMIVEEHPQLASLVYDDLITALRQAAPLDYPFIIACLGALGELRDTRCVTEIMKYVDASDFAVAQCACEALGKLPCEESLKTLQDLVERKDAHVNVLWAAELSLRKVRDQLRQDV